MVTTVPSAAAHVAGINRKRSGALIVQFSGVGVFRESQTLVLAQHTPSRRSKPVADSSFPATNSTTVDHEAVPVGQI